MAVGGVIFAVEKSTDQLRKESSGGLKKIVMLHLLFDSAFEKR
jgi:hypothetical protein